MNSVDSYQEVLMLRTFFKTVSQVSWDIAQLEKRHPFESCSDDELNSVKQAYIQYIELIRNALPY